MSHAPTDEQTAIISHVADSKSSLAVIARAGAAKTSTIVMAANTISRRSCLAVAFNVHSKKDLAQRLPSWVHVKTMNGLGYAAWQRTINRKLELDEDKASKLVSSVLKDNSIIDQDRKVWLAVFKLLSHARNAGLVPDGARGRPLQFLPDTRESWEFLCDVYDIDLEDIPADPIPLASEALLRCIEQGFAGVIDYTDQIFLPTCFRGAFPRYDVVFADEAQDLSALNHQMLRSTVNRKLIAVGDDLQAIYAFRGADSDSLFNLSSMFKCEQLKLTTTFRCSQAVVDQARRHAPDIQAAPWAPPGSIQRLREWSSYEIPTGSLICCRNNEPLMSIALKLLREGRPVNFLGRDVTQGLITLVEKICRQASLGDLQSASTEIFMEHLDAWQQAELASNAAKRSQRHAERTLDRAAGIKAATGLANTVAGIIKNLRALQAASGGDVTLGTGHRVKGLEAETVFHLDSELIPSAYAKSEAQLQQEANIDYVITTRAKKDLIYVSGRDYTA